jgi:hypothetical protein
MARKKTMDDCACVLVDVYGLAEVYRSSMRKARKAHKCSECHQAIAIGERYEYVFGVWNGVWNTYKTCPDCLEVREEFFCSGYYHGRLWENLGEHIFDCGFTIPIMDQIAQLPELARDKACHMVEETWKRLDCAENRTRRLHDTLGH